MQRTGAVLLTDKFIDAILAGNTELCRELLPKVDPDTTISSVKIDGTRFNSLKLIHIAAATGNEELLNLLYQQKLKKLNIGVYQADIQAKM